MLADSLPRELYKKIKNMDRMQMTDFFLSVYEDAYNNINYDKIAKEIGEIKGIGEVKLEQIMAILKDNIRIKEE